MERQGKQAIKTLFSDTELTIEIEVLLEGGRRIFIETKDGKVDLLLLLSRTDLKAIFKKGEVVICNQLESGYPAVRVKR